MKKAAWATVFYKNTAQNGTVKSVFKHLDSLVYAADELKREGYRDDILSRPHCQDMTSNMFHEGRPSPVRWFTLACLFGGTFGFTLQSITHLTGQWSFRQESPGFIPAFMVITFESTVLWGCLFTLVGLLVNCRLPAKDVQHELKDPRLSDDNLHLLSTI